MAAATVTEAIITSGYLRVTATVDEGVGVGVVPYTVMLPFDAAFKALNATQKKAAVAAALTAVRDDTIAVKTLAGAIGATLTI